MKKVIAMAVLCLAAMSLAGCGETPAPESREANGVVKWFDGLHGDDMAEDEVREYTLAEFPGVTFRWRAEQLEAVTDAETIPLYEGMPIWSVYFYDLTGDGQPELCSTLSMGSGMIDNRIIIYDYAGGASYELADRGNFDYLLNVQDDVLVVEKRVYGQDELVESGALVFSDETIQIKPE